MYRIRSVVAKVKRLPWRVCALRMVLVGLAAIACLFVAPKVHALQTVPYKMNFQGQLRNNAGNIMPDGLYNMKFRIYDASSAGTLQWNEDRLYGTPDNRVQVTNGLFSVQLGDVTALPPGIFTNQNLYFEIELPTPATATCATSACASFTEGPMTPRQKLGSSAYAVNADTIDGIDGASLAQLAQNNTFTGTQTLQNTTNSTAAFQVQKAAGSDVLLRADTTNNRVVIGNATGTDVDTTLLVLDSTTADPTTNLVDGAMYYNSTTGKFRCRQGGIIVDCVTGGGAKQITLVPEYAGAVLSADGTGNSMNVISGAVSGLVAAQGYKHNFYQWDTTATTAQNYDIVINYQLPSNFTSFVSGSFHLWTYADSLTNTNVTFMVKSNTGAVCYVSAVSVKPATAATWENKLPGDPGNGCTFAANDIVTFDIKPAAIQPSTNKVKIGEFGFAYQ